ncbi:MAG: ABC transporter ATP-binding protein [Acidobacteriota bacterium]|nr:ABC transporter ATP-binding protein [Acidobacteriota bacterium]
MKSPEAVAPGIALDGVTTRFGDHGGVVAHQDVSFEVRSGEFVSILGPSGCGKSTLVRVIAGLVKADAGETRVHGRLVDGPRPDVGVVFQSSTLLPWLTVAENLTLGAALRRRTPSAARVAELTQMLGLQGFERHYPHQLSGGMRQRAALGQILLLEPTLLLLDEPFGALDALTRDRLNVELLRIWERCRQTVLLVTHSIAEAVFLSDRVLVMSERPGSVTDAIDIDLPRPRQSSRVKADPAFAAYVAQLNGLMGVS